MTTNEVNEIINTLASMGAFLKIAIDLINKGDEEPQPKKRKYKKVKPQAQKPQATQQNNKNYFFTVADDTTQKYNIIVSDIEPKKSKSGQVGKYNIIVE